MLVEDLHSTYTGRLFLSPSSADRIFDLSISIEPTAHDKKENQSVLSNPVHPNDFCSICWIFPEN